MAQLNPGAVARDAAAAQTHPPRRSGRLRWIGLAVVAAAVVGGLWWFVFRERPPEPTDDPARVARFVSSSDFEDLPERDKRKYMRTLRANTKALDEARAAGRLSERQHRIASYHAWLERKLDRVDDYFDQPTAKAREQYLDELLAKRKAKQKPTTATPATGNSGAAPATQRATISSAKREREEEDDEDERDDWLEKQMKRWSAEDIARWEQFDDAFDARAKARGL